MNIEINNLKYIYSSGVNALHDISLQIPTGSRIALIGQNGSGKTTLARHLNGLLKPTEGEVIIGDWPSSEHSVAQLASRVGYSFQNPDEQLCKRKVWDEIAFGAINLGYDSNKVKEQVQWAISRMKLESYIDVNPHDLSMTNRRRVTIASVLAMDTPIIILDEPTTGQDQRFLIQLASLLDELQDLGKTVITISHDMDFVAEQFDRILVLGHGEILLDGSIKSVFKEEEILKSVHLQSPQIIRLARNLGYKGVVCSVNEFLDLRY